MFADIIKVQKIKRDLPQTTIKKAINDLRKRPNARVLADGGHFAQIM